MNDDLANGGPLSNTVVAEAPAKINPFLRVLGRREDGYHELETLILPVSLADTVRVHAYADPSMFRTLSFGLDVLGEPDLIRAVPVDETNLALRAAAAMGEEIGPRGFADIVIEKRIPAAAGLGGGSSDAAAVLIALNDLWGAGLDAEALADIGARVGSDVPALLVAGPAVARGRGERVEPVAVAAFEWLLVTFPFGVRTKDAFAWWDERMSSPHGEQDSIDLLEALANGDPEAVGPLLFNDLEEAVLERHPEIRDAKAALLEAGLPGVVLCGSGASLAGLLPAPTHGLEGVVARAEASVRDVKDVKDAKEVRTLIVRSAASA